MARYITNMPLWAILLFIAGFLYSMAIIANPAKQAAFSAGMNSNRSREVQFGIFGFYFIYLIYISILTLKGVFYINSIPPKIFVFGTIPLAIILFAIIANTGLFKKLLRAISLESLIAIHVFRFVGVFFLILYFYHLLPAGFAFSAGLGDILTALFALPVAKMVSKGKSWRIKAVYAWNIFGTLDIVTLLVIAIITARKSIISGGPGDLEMTLFPWVWFPAVAPATILFLHDAIFRKLQQVKTR
ncbi:MAG: hypothetical protein ACYCOO_05695 [Chitinophagaceae bacterium]